MIELAIFGASFCIMITVVTVSALRFATTRERRTAGSVYCIDCKHSIEWTHSSGLNPHQRCRVVLDDQGRPTPCGLVNKKHDCPHFVASESP